MVPEKARYAVTLKNSSLMAARLGMDLPRRGLLGLIAVYRRLISPLTGPRCRFYPSCSGYAAQALARHGLWRGLWLSTGRFFSCHPWSRRPFHDPVPPAAAAAEPCTRQPCDHD